MKNIKGGGATVNIFSDIPQSLPDELIETLTEGESVRIKRIVSRGHASPEGFWYDQVDNEWIMLLSGSAAVEIEGRGEVALSAGDYLLLPAHCRHRVNRTDSDADTVWLAVYFN